MIATCARHGVQQVTHLGPTTVTLACGGVGNTSDGFVHSDDPVKVMSVRLTLYFCGQDVVHVVGSPTNYNVPA